MIVLGIDPGRLGGLAHICPETGEVISAVKMPDTERDVCEAIALYLPTHAYIEKVHSSPQMGVRSAFTFGQGYGLLRGCLTALRVPFEEVRPAVWQTALGCRTKGDKNVTKQKAQQLYPELAITHMTADAILIARYGSQIQISLKQEEQ